MSLYNNIKNECSKAKMSISTLEKELGFARSSICKWDNNTPGVDKVKSVANILGCTVDDLLVGCDNSESEDG